MNLAYTFIFFILTFSASAEAIKADINCNELQRHKLIDFFNQDIKDKIINITPDFCLRTPNENPKDSEFNKIFNNLKKNAKTKSISSQKENDTFYIMKSLLLSKLWNRLTNEQRHFAFGIKGCSQPPELYLGFMEFNQENTKASTEDFKTYTDICKTKSPAQLLPFLDKSLILEYFFIINLAGHDFNYHQNNFCKLIDANNTRYILGSRFFDPKFNFKQFKKNVEWMFKTNFYKTFETISAVSELSETHHIPKQYKNAIAFYTGTYYTRINECLRNSSECNKELNLEVAQIKKGLKMIKKRELITFRGVAKLPFAITKKLKKGCLFMDPAFLSTSTEIEIAKEFAAYDGYLFVIRGKSGANVQNISETKFEKEVLYPNGTRFVVINDVEERSDDFTKHKVVYLRELSPLEKVRDCKN